MARARWVTCLGVTFALLSGSAAAPPAALSAPACQGVALAPAQDDPARARASLHCLVNLYRREHGRPPLRADPHLTRAAQAHGVEMAFRGFFGHASQGGPTLVERLRASGYLGRSRRWTAAEVLDWAPLDRAAPRFALAEWVRSGRHRTNILGSAYRDVGIGIETSTPFGRPGVTYVLNLGRRY